MPDGNSAPPLGNRRARALPIARVRAEPCAGSSRAEGWKVALAALTVLAWTPLACMLVGSAVVVFFGCAVDRASANPCIVAGRDIGEILVVMFLTGWFMPLGFPLMLATFAGWFVVWARRASGTGSPRIG